MGSNKWLYNKIKGSNLRVGKDFEPLIQVHKDDKVFRIYSPSPDEYLVTVDLVQKVIDLGGNTISYASSWAKATREAKRYGEQNGVQVVKHGELFGILGLRD